VVEAAPEPQTAPVKPHREPPQPAPKQFYDLPDEFVDRLPKLNIDIHSYDLVAEKSYVLINMEKYREGDDLVEGPHLSRILPNGVVLEYQGQRFILPIGNY
jgi:hypothetical protein